MMIAFIKLKAFPIITLPIRHFCLFLAAICFIAVSSPSMAAQTTNDEIPIAKIDFNGGQYIQENREAAIWVEYDFKGAARYEFTTQSFNGQFLHLRGRKGNVDLLIDVKNKTVSGEWPGHPMAKLYDVTNVIYLSSPETPVKPQTNRPVVKQTPPKLVREQPNYIPPGKNPPKAKDPVKNTEQGSKSPTASPTPVNLKIAEYRSGKFIRQNSHNWFEKSNSGIINSYNQIGFDKDSVYLYDPKRRLFIELNLQEKVAKSSTEGQAVEVLYPLTGFHKGAVYNDINMTPIEPPNQEPGKLSTVERTQCLTNGGFIERAGMLGYERCTVRYNDGGNICIDSSNCEGKCLADANAATQNAVSGLCQITDNPFGCYAEVIAGTVGPALCVD